MAAEDEGRTEEPSEYRLEKARKDGEKVKRELLFEAKEETHKLKMEVEKEIKEFGLIYRW